VGESKSRRPPTPTSLLSSPIRMAHRQSLAPRKATALQPSSSQNHASSSQQQQSKAVGYPILKAWDIVDVFQSLGISLTEEDVNKPTPFAIQHAWRQLLQETSGVTMEGFERPKGALLGMMQYPVSPHSRALCQHVRELHAPVRASPVLVWRAALVLGDERRSHQTYPCFEILHLELRADAVAVGRGRAKVVQPARFMRMPGRARQLPTSRQQARLASVVVSKRFSPRPVG
jgi:hypothetical protein